MVMEHHQSIIPLGKKHALKKYNQFLSLYVVYWLHLGKYCIKYCPRVEQFHEIFVTKMMNSNIVV